MSNREEWQKEHQTFELNYHKQGNYRWREPLWQDQWDKIFNVFGNFTVDSFKAGQSLLDVGCGSRPALEWFNDEPTKVYCDPLMNDYVKIPQMKDYWEGKEYYSVPAEEHLESLSGDFDFVLCWNVLDHCYDWRKVLRNVIDYAKSGGLLIVGTDLGKTPSPGHPGMGENARRLFHDMVRQDCEVLREEAPYHHRNIAVLLRKK